MENVSYKLTKDNKRPLMTTIYNNLGVWLESNAELEVCIRPHKSKRSVEQNRRLWKIYGELADKAWVMVGDTARKRGTSIARECF